MKDGTKTKLTDAHLAATIRLLERKASEGIVRMGSNQTEPAREPQVEIEVCKLEKRVAHVEALADTLIQRLEAIARPRGPNPDGEAEDRPQLVELAERLFGIDCRVSAIADNLQNLLDRIEL